MKNSLTMVNSLGLMVIFLFFLHQIKTEKLFLRLHSFTDSLRSINDTLSNCFILFKAKYRLINTEIQKLGEIIKREEIILEDKYSERQNIINSNSNTNKTNVFLGDEKVLTNLPNLIKTHKKQVSLGNNGDSKKFEKGNENIEKNNKKCMNKYNKFLKINNTLTSTLNNISEAQLNKHDKAENIIIISTIINQVNKIRSDLSKLHEKLNKMEKLGCPIYQQSKELYQSNMHLSNIIIGEIQNIIRKNNYNINFLLLSIK